MCLIQRNLLCTGHTRYVTCNIVIYMYVYIYMSIFIFDSSYLKDGIGYLNIVAYFLFKNKQ